MLQSIIFVFYKFIIVYGCCPPTVSGAQVHIYHTATNGIVGCCSGLMVFLLFGFNPFACSSGMIDIISASMTVMILGVAAGFSFTGGVIFLIFSPFRALAL